ncbi:CcmD family protein [candidate division KSB1 bacterium]|nr:CcmD family protein [candidate division KSB1 bacterium]
MNIKFLFIAFMVIWIGLVIYQTYLLKKISAAEKQIQLLKENLRENG